MKRKYETRITNHQSRTDNGSALILTVVLTSLLAIIGVMFIMVARVDKISTSAIIKNKELNLAVDSVIAKISEQLILDTPGIREPNQPMQEYYDYPDHRVLSGGDAILGTADDMTIYPGFDNILGTDDDINWYEIRANTWLANMEPEIVDCGIDIRQPAGTNIDFGFRHITDLYGRLAFIFQDSYDDVASVVLYTDNEGDRIGFRNMRAVLINPASPIGGEGHKADADGDGVADSRWIQLPDATGSRGEPIFAAVRIIDNSAMLNVNTVYANLGGSDERKGDMLTDIYIDGLIKSSPTETVAKVNFLNNRSNAPDASTYHREGAIRIENPDKTTGHFYTFYDISEELSLRNRFILYPNQTNTRLEAGIEGDPNRCLSTTLRWSGYGNSYAPYTTSDFGAWKRRFNPYDVGDDGSEPDENNYDFRHLLTTYNTDRIIDPNGNKMLNINTAPARDIYDTLLAIRDADPINFLITDAEAAQIAVNIKDYSDGNDPNLPSSLYDPDNNVSSLFGIYYGFERPCIYISELTHSFIPDAINPNIVYKSYAIELHKPYSVDKDPNLNEWRLVIDGNPVYIDSWTGREQFYVIKNIDRGAPGAPLPSIGTFQDSGTVVFNGGSNIQLQRLVANIGYVTVDDINSVPNVDFTSHWLDDLSGVDNVRSIERDIGLPAGPPKCIKRLWQNASQATASPSLGTWNSYIDASSYPIQAHPANKPFTNIGEIGMVFRSGVYYDPNTPADRPNRIGYGTLDEEYEVRINLAEPLANPDFQQLFKYLTVFDPSNDFIDNDGDGQFDIFDISEPEWKVPGRININTAPWYVIAQLPWVSDHTPNFDLARAIVDYRDNTGVGFDSIGQLNNFDIDPNYYRRIDYYAQDDDNLDGYPDLTPDDGVEDDFEERDVIFSRISNLVTVRSDVFTAYILVRIGTDGPQKRVIAILDRSDVYSPADRVKIVALHPVPDPR